MISVEKLQLFPRLAILDMPFLEELASISEEKTIEKGEWLFHEGEDASAMYLIENGSVELKAHLDKERDIYATVSTSTEGDAVGWSAMVEPYSYRLGATVSEQALLIRIDGNRLRPLLEANPEQGYVLMQGIAKTVASRVDTLSQASPGLSARFIAAQILASLGIVSGVLAAILVMLALIAALSGVTEGIVASLLCLIIPITLFWAASQLHSAEQV